MLIVTIRISFGTNIYPLFTNVEILDKMYEESYGRGVRSILQIGGEIMDLPTATFVVLLLGLVVQIIAVTKK